MSPKTQPTTTPRTWREKWTTAKISYNYCGICGHTPKQYDEPNRAPIRFWDPDDGWKITTLCRYCCEEFSTQEPSPEDYAYSKYYELPEANIETDEDPIEAL